MKYEKLLLHLMEKVTDLEDRLELLEENKKDNSENNTNSEIFEKNRQDKELDISNKSFVTKYLTNILQESTKFSIKKAKRAEGGGLILSDANRELKVKLAVSKNHIKKENTDYEWRGWHTLSEEELDTFDFYIFAVKAETDEPYYFVFSNTQLKELCSKKEIDSSGKYHFYFVKDYDDRTYEDRDDRIDVSDYFNNFSFNK